MFKVKAPNGTNNICGPVLLQWRKEHHLSQQELSAKMQVAGYDLDKYAIRRIENGERFVTDTEVLAFSEVLGISKDELLKRPDVKDDDEK